MGRINYNHRVRAMQVRSYDLLIDLDFENLKFKGRVLIELESEHDVVLDSAGLDTFSVKAGEKEFRFRQRGEGLTIETGPFEGVLEINYAGLVPHSLVGIYSAPYNHNHIVTTHFEAANARRMLPCIDRPDCKAEFKLTVRMNKDLDAISNMPVDAIDIEAEKKTVSFQKTPLMSTYLLYLGVGKFAEQREKADQTDVILATTPGKVGSGRFAQDVAKKAIKFFESYYNIPYMLPKVHLIAVPEFAAGAMENWGAITFREAALLVDANTSTRTRRLVAEVVAHELAHQWFGNLVTMKWWDDVWLNESLATFMAYKVVDAVHSDWKMWDDFLNSETSGALARDCLKNTHPIQVQVQSPDEIEQIFDAISYGKGASILRMIEAYIGKDAFREGIRHYLSSHAYSNATGNDLWSSFEESSGEQVKMIMSRWIQNPGYPVVNAVLKDGKLTLRQERFLLSGTPDTEVWPIPVGMELNGEPKNFLLEKEERTFDVKDIKSLRVNVDRTGFYRVHYSGLYDILWRSKLSALDRWGIISDAFSFLLSGKMPFNDYLALTNRFNEEGDYLPAREVSDQLSLLYAIVPTNVSELSRTFHRTQLKILRERSDEKSSMLRGIMASRLALVDGAYATELASKFKDYERVEPDMKLAVAVAYSASTGDYDGLLRRYRESRSDEDKVRLLNAMTAFRDEKILMRSLDFALSGEVKRQDVRSVVLAATEKPDARNVAWTWLRVNIGKIRALYEGTGLLSGIFLSTIPILGIGRIQEVEKFFSENKMPEAEKGMRAGLEKLEVYERLVKSIDQEVRNTIP